MEKWKWREKVKRRRGDEGMKFVIIQQPNLKSKKKRLINIRFSNKLVPLVYYFVISGIT